MMPEALDTAASAPDSTFVGRAREITLFETAFERMLGEKRQVLAVVGEPGIGKTRSAEAFARAAEEQGALALWGRCYEGPGAPPYWPWVQIIREYVAASSPDEVRLMMGARARDLAALVPDLAEGADPTGSDPAELTEANFARFRTFDAIGRFFAKASAQVPLVLVIDDIHWADAPSLSLLEFLAQELARCRVLVLVTYRDTEVSRKSPLVNTLGGLSRGTEFVHVRLSGLSGDAVGELARNTLGEDLADGALGAILEQTDGNPLFVIELLKVLVEEAADASVEPIAVRIPDGVRETIGRRLSRLPERCNDMLTAASVLGRHFSTHELAATTGVAIDAVIANLDLAAHAGIVEAASDEPGGYRFTHALIRETLYDEIPKLDRLRLHGRVGDALVRIHGTRVEADLPRIAHHYYEAAPIGYLDQAADIAMRAAEHATRLYAFEEAIVHYDQTISALELNGRSDDERVAQACFRKGWTLALVGEVGKAVTTLLDAANRVHGLGNWTLFADVLVHLVMATSYGRQDAHVPLLEKVLGVLPEDESPIRAKVLAALAFALRGTNDIERVDSLVHEAVSMARRIEDRPTRWVVFKNAMPALRGRPETLERRLDLAREYFAIEPNGDHDLIGWQLLNLLEAGRIAELEALLQRFSTMVMTQFGLHRCYLETARITLALLRGEWAGLDARIEQLLEIVRKTRPNDGEGVYGAQMFALNRDLGRLRELEPLVRQFTKPGGSRAWTPALMVICAELGMLDETREALDRFARNAFEDIVRDEMYETRLVYCAEACWRVGDVERAHRLYDLLLPHARLTVNHPRAVCFGAADLYLGMMASVSGRREQARMHYEAALTMNRAMEAWPWLARTQLRYGASLLSSEDAQHQEAGRTFLRDAEQLAGRLGMKSVAAEARLLLKGNGEERESFPDDLTAREVDVLRLIAIGRSNKDISMVLSISLNTVATHVRNILTKTHCANRTEAAAYALRLGVQRPG